MSDNKSKKSLTKMGLRSKPKSQSAASEDGEDGEIRSTQSTASKTSTQAIQQPQQPDDDISSDESQDGYNTLSDDEGDVALDNSDNQTDSDPKLDFQSQILSMFKVIQNDVRDIKTKLKNAETQSQNAVKIAEKLETQVADMDNSLRSLKSKYEVLNNKHELLSEKYIQLEAYTRRENLIFKGITYTEKEDCTAKIKRVLTEVLHMNADIVEKMMFQRCHRLGNNSNSKSKDPPPIICKFVWYEDRQQVWKAKSKLKDSSLTISEDYPKEIADRRRILYPIMKRARELEMNSFLSGDRLIIDKKPYTVDTIHSLENQLSPELVSTRQADGVTCFFTESSPLSNFYPCDVVIGKHRYHSVEQYFQQQKALFAELPETAAKILQAKHPRICKGIGDSIKIDDQKWLPEATQVLLRGLRAKFEQNEKPKLFLMNTGQNHIGEASPSNIWGIGKKLSDPTVLDKSSWVGKNVVGEVLMQVRKELSET